MEILWKFLTAGHLVLSSPCPASRHLDTASKIWTCLLHEKYFWMRILEQIKERLSFLHLHFLWVIFTEKSDTLFSWQAICLLWLVVLIISHLFKNYKISSYCGHPYNLTLRMLTYLRLPPPPAASGNMSAFTVYYSCNA